MTVYCFLLTTGLFFTAVYSCTAWLAVERTPRSVKEKRELTTSTPFIYFTKNGKKKTCDQHVQHFPKCPQVLPVLINGGSTRCRCIAISIFIKIFLHDVYPVWAILYFIFLIYIFPHIHYTAKPRLQTKHRKQPVCYRCLKWTWPQVPSVSVTVSELIGSYVRPACHSVTVTVGTLWDFF